MDIKVFTLSRDLLYLSGVLAGLALGCFWSIFKKDIDIRSRDRRITAVLFILSAFIASLALTFIFSNGAIFKDTGVLVIAGLCIPVCALAVYFPRTVAFPLIILSGLFVVWMGYSCLRFPAVSNSPLALISRSSTDIAAKNENLLIFADEDISLVHLSAAVIEIDLHYPAAGGKKRVLLTEARSDTGTLYSDKSLQGPFLKALFGSGSGKVLGIDIKKLNGTVSLEGLVRGEQRAVFITELTAGRE